MKNKSKNRNINLHIHTTHIDGGLSVAEIVARLKEEGVQYFSITDHDSIEGNIEAAELAKKYGMTYYNGIELSCSFADGELGFDESFVCHIIGLDFKLDSMKIWLDYISKGKQEKVWGLYELLIKDGYNIDLEKLKAGKGVISRKVIADELIAKGYAKDRDECYAKILNTDKYKKYANTKPTIEKGIEFIKKSGGLAIWAHPFGITRGGKRELTESQVLELYDRPNRTQTSVFLVSITKPGGMKQYGIDGIEVYYHKYDKAQIEFLESLADKEKLFKSIGTDFHLSDFDEEKFPQYKALRDKESLVFDASGITPDTSLTDILEARKNKAKFCIQTNFENDKPRNRQEYCHITIWAYGFAMFDHWFDGSREDENNYSLSRQEAKRLFDLLGLTLTDTFDKIKAAFEAAIYKFKEELIEKDYGEKFHTSFTRFVKKFLEENNFTCEYSSWTTYD